MDTVVNDLQFIGSDLTFINKLVHSFCVGVFLAISGHFWAFSATRRIGRLQAVSELLAGLIVRPGWMPPTMWANFAVELHRALLDGNHPSCVFQYILFYRLDLTFTSHLYLHRYSKYNNVT